MVVATVARSVDGCERDLRTDEQFLRTEVLRTQMDQTVDVVGRSSAADRPILFPCRALTDQQAVHLDHQHDGDGAEQHADRDGADAVPNGFSGQHRQPDTGQRERQADERARSSSRTTGSSGLRELRMNRHQLPEPFSGRDSLTAVRKL